MRAQSTRTLWGGLTALAMVVTSVSPLAVLHAQAAAATPLVISEINWAGSASNPTDQWVELYNPGTAAISFAATPYHLDANGVDIADLTSGVIPAGHTFLVTRVSPTMSPSSLDSVFANPDFIDASLVLPTHDVAYTLTDTTTGTVVDKADTGAGAPLAGSSSPIASMSRIDVTIDGSLPAAWATSATVGLGFNTVQYGTPENSTHAETAPNPNPAMALPTNLAISSVNPTGANPVVTGTVLPVGSQTPAKFVSVTLTRLDAAGTVTQQGIVNPTTGAFSVQLPASTPGLYRATVAARADAIGNTSAWVTVPVPGSAQNVYVIKTSATLAAPNLDAYPAATTLMSVTLTGTAPTGANLVVSVNGAEVASAPVTANAFSIPVTLVANSVNQIEVRAEDTATSTFSLPAVATILQNSKGPVLNAALIKVTSNPPGTQDEVSGAAQAVTDLSPATLYVYSDAALTQQVATGTPSNDGSFTLKIGDNLYQTVYVVAKDTLGNVSAPLMLTNPTAFVGSVSFGLTNVGLDKVTLTIQPATGAANYLLKYKAGTAAYSAPIQLCATISSCTLQRQIVNLSSNTGYTFAVAAVDQFGNVGSYTEKSVTTLAPAPVAVIVPAATTTTVSDTTVTQTPAPEAATAPQATGSSQSTTVTPSPTPTSTPAPDTTVTPSPSPETGQVQGAESTQSRNYTPWIILAVLIALAILATAGYFYWFGGEAGETAVAATAAAAVAAKQTKDAEAAPTSPAKDTSEQAPPPKKDKEKRW